MSTSMLRWATFIVSARIGGRIRSKYNISIIKCFLLFFEQIDPQLNEATKNEIKEQAIIYRKTTNRPLTSFQAHVNQAAIELALSQPRLVRSGMNFC